MVKTRSIHIGIGGIYGAINGQAIVSSKSQRMTF
jgi:hypothetical protein